MTTHYHGRPTRRIETPHLSIEVLAAAGPRIVRVNLKSNSDLPFRSGGADPDHDRATIGENQFAEVPSAGWDTPYGRYDLLGGHRLWHSPEAFPRSYIPDDKGIEIDVLPDGLRLVGVPEEATGLKKTMEISVDPDRAAITVRHLLKNTGLWPVEAAPWAITQMPLGGVAVFPMAAPGPSPYSPNRHVQLWGYTHWDDPRLELHDLCALVHARPGGAVDDAHPNGDALKFGFFDHSGWAGYLRAGTLFVKRFEVQAPATHPDGGCNVESYLDNRFIEIETLGRLSVIEPGGEVFHTEEWRWHEGLQAAGTVEGVRQLMGQLGLPGREHRIS